MFIFFLNYLDPSLKVERCLIDMYDAITARFWQLKPAITNPATSESLIIF